MIRSSSSSGVKALSMAIQLANRISAKLHMVVVEELSRFPASINEIVEEKDEANRRFAPVIEGAGSGEDCRREN